jgi:hypothetical protein
MDHIFVPTEHPAHAMHCRVPSSLQWCAFALQRTLREFNDATACNRDALQSAIETCERQIRSCRGV